MSETINPVDALLESARDPSKTTEFKVTGVMMQYYEICKRELWFASRNLEIDRENPAVVRGTHVDDTAYKDNRRNISVRGWISIDVLEDGSIIEVKPSSTIVEGAKLQLLYYLWFLKHVLNVERTGILAHPTERRRETIELTTERENRVEDAIRGIYAIINQDSPPQAEEKPFCESCAYHDFCWSC